jgi:hypothetical protein
MKIRQKDDIAYELFDDNPDGTKTIYGLVDEAFLDEITAKYNAKTLLEANGEIEFELISRDI